METILLIISSITVVLSFLSTLWVYRCGCTSKIFRLSTLVILLFAGWEFIHHLHVHDHIFDAIIVKLFILFNIFLNSYHAYHNHDSIEVGENRRAGDRRQTERRKNTRKKFIQSDDSVLT